MLKLQERFKECGLELHPEKTKIIYCKDNQRKGNHQNTKFKFLGYEFCSRAVKGSNKRVFGALRQQLVQKLRKIYAER